MNQRETTEEDEDIYIRSSMEEEEEEDEGSAKGKKNEEYITEGYIPTRSSRYIGIFFFKKNGVCVRSASTHSTNSSYRW